MLRRLARPTRFALLGAGLLLLLWLPASWMYVAHLSLPWPNLRSGAYVCNGKFVIFSTHHAGHSDGGTVRAGFEELAPFMRHSHGAVWPRVNRFTGVIVQTSLSLPIWILAVALLAWPVTSHIVTQRRRRKRGFPLDAAAGASPLQQTS